MTMKYVRDTYGVPVKRGMVVRAKDSAEEYRVTFCTHYVRCVPRFYSSRWSSHYRRYQFHPRDLEYKTDEGWVSS